MRESQVQGASSIYLNSNSDFGIGLPHGEKAGKENGGLESTQKSEPIHLCDLLKDYFILSNFGCHGSLLPQSFPSCSEWELVSSCGVPASHCSGFSCHRAPALCAQASIVWAHGLSCHAAWAQLPCSIWIFPDQGSNLCPLPWQADSLPLDHEGNAMWSSNV